MIDVMENDRHEERIQLLEKESLAMQLVQAKIDVRLNNIEFHIAEIRANLQRIMIQIDDVIPKVNNIRQWGDIYKNLMLVALGGLVTGTIGFILHQVLGVR